MYINASTINIKAQVQNVTVEILGCTLMQALQIFKAQLENVTVEILERCTLMQALQSLKAQRKNVTVEI